MVYLARDARKVRSIRCGIFTPHWRRSSTLNFHKSRWLCHYIWYDLGFYEVITLEKGDPHPFVHLRRSGRMRVYTECGLRCDRSAVTLHEGCEHAIGVGASQRENMHWLHKIYIKHTKIMMRNPTQSIPQIFCASTHSTAHEQIPRSSVTEARLPRKVA